MVKGLMELIFRMERSTRVFIEKSLLTLAILLMVAQLFVIHLNIKAVHALASLPVQFEGEWIPDREEYNPGDVIRLAYVQKVTKSDALPLLVVSVESFENVDTREVHPGAIVGRAIQVPGDIKGIAVRQVPPTLKDGTYFLEGWMTSQTNARILPATYRSKPIRIKQ